MLTFTGGRMPWFPQKQWDTRTSLFFFSDTRLEFLKVVVNIFCRRAESSPQSRLPIHHLGQLITRYHVP
jgi:hypothetical protein